MTLSFHFYFLCSGVRRNRWSMALQCTCTRTAMFSLMVILTTGSAPTGYSEVRSLPPFMWSWNSPCGTARASKERPSRVRRLSTSTTWNQSKMLAFNSVALSSPRSAGLEWWERISKFDFLVISWQLNFDKHKILTRVLQTWRGDIPACLPIPFPAQYKLGWWESQKGWLERQW